jgi:hypothetical protein
VEGLLRNRPEPIADLDWLVSLVDRQLEEVHRIEHLSTAYMDTLDWAVGVLDERREAIESGRGRIRWWRRPVAAARGGWAGAVRGSPAGPRRAYTAGD